MRVRNSAWAHRVKGFLSLRSGLALCGALLLVVVLARQLSQFRSDNRLDIRGQTLTDFIQQLPRSGFLLFGDKQLVERIREACR